MASFDDFYRVPASAAISEGPTYLDFFCAPYQPGGSLGSAALLKGNVRAMTTHVRFGDVPTNGPVVMCGLSGAPISVMIKVSADSLVRVQEFACASNDPPVPARGSVADTSLIVLAGSPMFAQSLAESSDVRVRDTLSRLNVVPVGYSAIGRPTPLPSAVLPAIDPLRVSFANTPGNVSALLSTPGPHLDFSRPKSTKLCDLYALRCWANVKADAVDGLIARVTEVNTDLLNALALRIPIDWRLDCVISDMDLFFKWVTGKFAKTVGEKDAIDVLQIIGSDVPISKFVIQGRLAQFFELIDMMFGTSHFHAWAVAVNRRLDALTRQRNGADASELNSYLATAWTRVLHRLGIELRKQVNAEGTSEQLQAVLENLKTCPDEDANSWLAFDKVADGISLDSKRPPAATDKSRPARKKAKSGNSAPSPFGDLPVPCFRHILHKAKVRPGQPCPMAPDDCHFCHGPFQDYSAAATLAYFEEKLFSDTFPKEATRAKAVSTVKKWMPSAHFAK